MKNILLAIFLTTLTGCGMANAIRQSIGLYGADAADQALETALFALCKGTTVGAIDRRFKTQAEKDAWSAFCATLDSP